MPKKIANRRAERYREFLKFFINKYQPRCYFCNEVIDWKWFFPILSGRDNDGFTIHHIDEDRENNDIENLTICHRGCHRRHHREDQILTRETGEKKNYNIKELTTVKIKYKKEKL